MHPPLSNTKVPTVVNNRQNASRLPCAIPPKRPDICPDKGFFAAIQLRHILAILVYSFAQMRNVSKHNLTPLKNIMLKP